MLILLLNCFIVYCLAQNFEIGDNATIKGCSSHCSMHDIDLSCWNQTLNFYEQILFSQMKFYIAVQINIDRWHRRRFPKYVSNFSQIKLDTIHNLNSLVAKGGIIDNNTIVTVVNALVDQVQKNSRTVESHKTHIACPLPCEYKSKLWRYLFIASCALNILLAILGLQITSVRWVTALICHFVCIIANVLYGNSRGFIELRDS
ncbi:unnamed protein product [Dracunculus medinensis]|uniref:Protein tweety homolog n=1 Tax=Dracunculus medinensis TaxID=318479 RepID=A0A0N4UA04_DRAME|nr:unnamed protein product [Dracunculus medinensis]